MSTELCLHELEAVDHKCVDVRQEHRYIPRKDLFTSYIQTLSKDKQIMDYLINVVYRSKGDAVIVRACIKDPNFTCELRDEFKVVVKFFDNDTEEKNRTKDEYPNRTKEQEIYSCNVSNFKHPFFTFPLARYLEQRRLVTFLQSFKSKVICELDFTPFLFCKVY